MAVLVAATAMLFGWDIWIEFWQKVVPQQQWLTEHGDGLLFAMVSSVFYGARLLHLPVRRRLGAARDQWRRSPFAAVVWTYWKRRDPALSLALFVTATFLVTPYILNYDMVVFGFVVALLRERDRQHNARPLAADRGLDAAGDDDDRGRRSGFRWRRSC